MYESLDKFFKTYLHQDWDLVSGTPEASMAQYVRDGDAKDARQIIDDIDAVLALQLQDAALVRLIEAMGPSIHLPTLDVSALQWLEGLRRVAVTEALRRGVRESSID